MERLIARLSPGLRRTGAWMLLATAAGCGGGGGAGPVTPAPAGQPATATPEQTLSDLFNVTALYQRMGRLAGSSPMPFVGQVAYFAGRGDSTIAVVALSLDNRSLSFQRTAGEFVGRYRVEITFQPQEGSPLRFAKEELVAVARYEETQRADESVVFQQAFLFRPGKYQLTVQVRDPLSTSTSKTETAILVPSFPAGSFTAPVLVYGAAARPDLWQEPAVLVNPRGIVAHGVDSMAVLVEAYGLTAPTRLPFQMRDEQERVVLEEQIEFQGGRAVEARRITFAPEAPTLGRMTLTVGPPGQTKESSALVSFSRAWVVTNYDNLLNLLRFFGYSSDLNLLRNADPGARAQLWREFWEKTDPNPMTSENEALEQYFTRVAFANERFRDEGAGQGWRSDRGEVLITIGPPDQEIESPPGADIRVAQWLYNDYRAVLTFSGQAGFNRLRLTPTSRAEFQRIRSLVWQQEGRRP